MREPLEHAAEHEHAEDVLHAADDVHEAVRPVATRGTERGRHVVVLRRQDVKAQGQVQVDGGLPNGVVVGVVVILVLGRARHHHADEPQRLGGLHVLDRLIDRLDGGLGQTEQPRGLLGAEAGEPAVVRGHARRLVREVGVGAQHHADRRVDQLAADVLLVLDGDAGVRVERRRIDLIEAVPPRRA